MKSIKLILFILFFQTTLIAEQAIPSLELPAKIQYPYSEPTKRFNAYYNYERILSALRSNGMSLEQRNFFEHIIPHEELGFFGYHSSTQKFRIFQDIIRITLEEICDIPTGQDFHFLRAPGSPINCRESAHQFLSDYPFVNNYSPEQQEQLLSMNYALFGNFNNFGSCSVFYFTTGHSGASVDFQGKLRTFFETLGLPVDALPGLFAIGNPLLEHNAILLQFFDFSHHNGFHLPYTLVDRMCYEAIPGGTPQRKHETLSEMYLGTSPQPFTQQFRLVINNAAILNPFSPLVIKRYERNSAEIVEEYEAHLHEAIRALPHDKEKAKLFRQSLLSIWGQSDE